MRGIGDMVTLQATIEGMRHTIDVALMEHGEGLRAAVRAAFDAYMADGFERDVRVAVLRYASEEITRATQRAISQAIQESPAISKLIGRAVTQALEAQRR